MSFSFRDKPRLSDRLRGKSGDELINELKNQIDQERKMFFDTSPNWGSVHPSGSFSSRAGFPFDDDMMPRSGRQDIRSHLDDLAQRHPEFADQLRCPPWAGEMSGSPSHTGTWGWNRRGSNEGEGHSQASSSSSVGNCETGETSPKPEEIRGRNPISQHGLRNTVDLGQKQGEPGRDDSSNRGQRSMSAPPGGRNPQPTEPQKQPQPPQHPQRFVSRVNITPGKPPVAPQKQSSQQSPQQSTSNVRHIPIFVEGRDEPLLPKNVAEGPPPEQVFSQKIPPQPKQQTFTSHHQFQPQQPRTEYTRPQQPMQQPKAETIFSHQTSVPSTQQDAAPNQKQSPKPSQHSKVPQPNDPISRVQIIQKDVENFQRMVDNFSGTSRKDKQYIYLDEMLTRNLLKLDDIDTEGKETVRQARKDAIRSIQRCISILESKVPSADEQSQAQASEEAKDTQPVEGSDNTEVIEKLPEKMETETTLSQSAAVENTDGETESMVRDSDKETEKMEVESTVPEETCMSELKSASPCLSASASTGEIKGSGIDDKGAENEVCSDVPLDMDVTVGSQAPGVSSGPCPKVNSENPAEKEDKTSEMEVEPPVSDTKQTQLMSETSQGGATVESNVEAAATESELSTETAGSEQPEKTKEVSVEHINIPELDTSESKEAAIAETGDLAAMQVESLSSNLDIEGSPKSKDSGMMTKETVTESTSSEQSLEKEPKQECDLKKKKMGRKLKSPSKKPPKQASNSKPDMVTSSDEAQKS